MRVAPVLFKRFECLSLKMIKIISAEFRPPPPEPAEEEAYMNSTNIKYLSQLIEPKIMNTCRWTEEELKGHLQLDQETAHQVVIQAMRNIVGRDIRWNQPQPGRARYQKTNYQHYHVYTDSDLSVPVAEIAIE